MSPIAENLEESMLGYRVFRGISPAQGDVPPQGPEAFLRLKKCGHRRYLEVTVRACSERLTVQRTFPWIRIRWHFGVLVELLHLFRENNNGISR